MQRDLIPALRTLAESPPPCLIWPFVHHPSIHGPQCPGTHSHLAYLDAVNFDAVQRLRELHIECERVLIVDFPALGLFDEHSDLAACKRLQRAPQLLILNPAGCLDVLQVQVVMDPSGHMLGHTHAT